MGGESGGGSGSVDRSNGSHRATLLHPTITPDGFGCDFSKTQLIYDFTLRFARADRDWGTDEVPEERAT